MDGRYIKVGMADYVKEKGLTLPAEGGKTKAVSPKPKPSPEHEAPADPKADTLESVLEYDSKEKSNPHRPAWDNSSKTASYKMNQKELIARRELRTSKNLAAAQVELRKKSSRFKKPVSLPKKIVLNTATGKRIKQVTLPRQESVVIGTVVDRANEVLKRTEALLEPKSKGSRSSAFPGRLPFSKHAVMETGASNHQPELSSTGEPMPTHGHGAAEDSETAAALAQSIKELRGNLATITREYAELKKEFEAQKASIDTVKEERDRNERKVKDLSQILGNNQEAQINMVSVIQELKGKMEMLEERGLLEPSASNMMRKAIKKVSFHVSAGESGTKSALSKAQMKPKQRRRSGTKNANVGVAPTPDPGYSF